MAAGVTATAYVLVAHDRSYARPDGIPASIPGSQVNLMELSPIPGQAGAGFHPDRPGRPGPAAVRRPRQGRGPGVHGSALHRQLPDRVRRRQRQPVPHGRRRRGGVLPRAPAASAITYLASDEASFVHGAVIDVDGGRNAAYQRPRRQPAFPVVLRPVQRRKGQRLESNAGRSGPTAEGRGAAGILASSRDDQRETAVPSQCGGAGPDPVGSQHHRCHSGSGQGDPAVPTGPREAATGVLVAR